MITGMKDRIRAAIQSGHSSTINGIDTDRATDAVVKLVRRELLKTLNEIEDSEYPWDVTFAIKERYEL